MKSSMIAMKITRVSIACAGLPTSVIYVCKATLYSIFRVNSRLATEGLALKCTYCVSSEFSYRSVLDPGCKCHASRPLVILKRAPPIDNNTSKLEVEASS